MIRIVYMFLLGKFPVQAQAHKFHAFGIDIHSFLSNADLQEFDKMHGVCTVHVCTYFLYPPQLGARLIDDRGVLSTSLHLKTILNAKFHWAWVYKDHGCSCGIALTLGIMIASRVYNGFGSRLKIK